MKKPDFIIVGAGSCGCVVARTLLEQGFRVCLLEAGANLPVNRRPAEYVRLFGGLQDWSYSTTPQPELAGRRIPFPRGRGPGGSTRINAMIWYPPQERDWQSWFAAGGDAWHPERLKRSLQQVEAWIEPETPRWLSTSTQQVLQVCQSQGLAFTPFRRMTRQSRRRTAFDLIPEQCQSNGAFTVHQATARRVCIEDERAVGVEVETSAGNREQLTAQHGVILCGGAIASPQLLFASGVGAKDELRTCQIDCIVDLPELGKRLTDHLIMPVIYQRPDAPFPSGATVGDLTRWEYLGTGPLASNLAEAGGTFETSEGKLCQLHLTPTHYLLHPSDRSPAALTLGVNAACPDSQGQVRWERDAATGPLQTLIDPGYCTLPSDRETLLAAVRWARQLGQELQRQGIAGEELIPGQRRSGNDADLKAIARFSQTLYHPCGTCRMGSDSTAIVDTSLAVRGLERLWVIDASISPTIPCVNPNALLMSIAHQAALVLSSSNTMT